MEISSHSTTLKKELGSVQLKLNSKPFDRCHSSSTIICLLTLFELLPALLFCRHVTSITDGLPVLYPSPMSSYVLQGTFVNFPLFLDQLFNFFTSLLTDFPLFSNIFTPHSDRKPTTLLHSLFRLQNLNSALHDPPLNTP